MHQARAGGCEPPTWSARMLPVRMTWYTIAPVGSLVALKRCRAPVSGQELRLSYAVTTCVQGLHEFPLDHEEESTPW